MYFCITNRKDLEEEGFDYHQKNHTLAIESISLLDKFKSDIYRNLWLNYREIENFISPSPLLEEDNSKNLEFDMAITLLREVTQGGYNLIRD